MNSPTVIITGAAGFIGSALAMSVLDRGCRVIGIDNFDPLYDVGIKRANVSRLANRSAKDQFELVEADVVDARTTSALFVKHQPQVVFHLAALAGVRPSIAQPRKYSHVNIDGLIHVLEACRASNCRHVIFASSSSVYGNNSKVPFAEDDPVENPVSPYAATKRAGEIICQTYARVYGLRIAAVRLFTVFGPAQRPDLAIAKFMRLIAQGDEVPMFGDGSTSRDYTFIDDAVAGIIAADSAMNRQVPLAPGIAGGTTRGHPGELPRGGFFRIYNIGSDHPIALRDMIDAIARVVGKPARIKHLPIQPGDVERTWADLTRSRAELGCRPATEFEQGLRRQWARLAGDDEDGAKTVEITVVSDSVPSAAR